MRIYFIGQKGIPTLAGGIEKHVESVATRMAALGHEVFVYTRPNYSDPKVREYNGVKLISLPSLNSKNFDTISHTFLASIHVLFQKADVINYQGVGPSILLWIPKIFKRKTKIISTIHSDDRQHQKWSKLAKLMLGLGAWMAVRLADASIAVSKHQKIMFEREFGRPINYIPNGVTIYPPFAPDVITKRYGLKGNDFILFLSRFVPHKGLHYLIEAYNQIENPQKKLVIVGDSAHTDEYSEQIQKMAEANKNIIFTGVLKGLPLFELYSNAYLYVIPSEYEGFSIALLEVMSYGTPVLASDIEPNLEALGGLGFTFENKNVADLREKLTYLLANPDVVEKSKPALKERVSKEYNWDVITQKMLQLYNS